MRRDRCRHRPRRDAARRRHREQRRRARPLRRGGARGRQPGAPRGDGADHRTGLCHSGSHAPRRGCHCRHVRPGPGRRPHGGRRLGEGALAVARGAAVRGQPPRQPRRRRHRRARPAARAHPRDARLRWALLAAPRARRDARRAQPRVDDRRRRGGGLRQGGPGARSAVPGGPAHRPDGARGLDHDRLPARAHDRSRHGAAPVRLLVQRAQDRRVAVGAGPGGGGGAGARRRRRRELPGGRDRRADPQGRAGLPRARRRSPADRWWRRRELAPAGDGAGAVRRGRHPAAGAAAGAVHRQRGDGRRPRRPDGDEGPRTLRPRPARPTPRCR